MGKIKPPGYPFVSVHVWSGRFIKPAHDYTVFLYVTRQARDHFCLADGMTLPEATRMGKRVATGLGCALDIIKWTDPRMAKHRADVAKERAEPAEEDEE